MRECSTLLVSSFVWVVLPCSVSPLLWCCWSPPLCFEWWLFLPPFLPRSSLLVLAGLLFFFVVLHCPPLPLWVVLHCPFPSVLYWVVLAILFWCGWRAIVNDIFYVDNVLAKKKNRLTKTRARSSHIVHSRGFNLVFSGGALFVSGNLWVVQLLPSSFWWCSFAVVMPSSFSEWSKVQVKV